MRYKWIEQIRIVKGYNRASICDLPRNNYQFAPKDIMNLIQKIEHHNFNELKDIDEDERCWLNDFIANEYITLVPHSHYDYFSSLDLSWEHPSIIISAIIHEMIADNIIPILDELVCKQIVILIENINSLETILKKHFKETNYQGVEFILNQIDVDIEEIDLDRLKLEYPVLRNVIKKGQFGDSIQDLIVNIELFTESNNFHNYFNRKLYVNENGEIKNSIELDTIYGNISNVLDANEFVNIVKSKEFQAIWGVKKDNCDVCKHCELRYICVDNRVPYQRNEKEWYHKLECNYNPYICKWKGEEGYKTLAECGVTFNEHEFSIDHEKIALINKELWEDE